MVNLNNKTYYQILGISRDATEVEIELAYRDLSRIYDPCSDFYTDLIDDPVSPAEVEIFHKITRAYQTLRNPAERASYDEHLRIGAN